MNPISTLCFFLSLFIFLDLQGQAIYWNTGSGGNPSRNGQSFQCGPVDNETLWEEGLPSVIAFQAKMDSNVVATSRIFDLQNTLDGTVIVAHDIPTGDTLWTTQLPIEFPDTDWRNRVTAARDGKIYATRSGNTNASYLYALDAADGSILWESEDLISESSTESASFASNGDLIIGNNDNIARVNHLDGTTIWSTSRTSPTSNGQEVAVFGDRGYYWEASPQGPEISVIDLNSGAFLYSSPGMLGLIQQAAPFVGPDGTVYAPRFQNNPITDSLFAYVDNGSEFIKKWSIPIAYVPFATFGVGPDGSVYSYSRTGKIIRLAPETGAVVDSSEVVILGEGAPSPRMAIDAKGRIFVTKDDGADSELYSFDPDLTVRWSDPIPNINVGGPALGADGTLVVCGVGTTMRAYRGEGCPITDWKDQLEALDLSIFPNPASQQLQIEGIFKEDLRGELLNNLGISIHQFIIPREAEQYTLSLSNLVTGIYYLKLEGKNRRVTRKILIQQ